jgi:ribosomal protein L29
MAKKTTYIEKDVTELNKLLGERREELRTLRFTAAGARTKDSNASAKVKKEIARILTALSAKNRA